MVSMPREVKDPTQGLNVEPVVDGQTLTHTEPSVCRMAWTDKL